LQTYFPAMAVNFFGKKAKLFMPIFAKSVGFVVDFW